jgi:hypothetical protein
MSRFSEPDIENLTSPGLPGVVTTNISGEETDDRSDPNASVIDTVTDDQTEDFSYSGDTVTDRFTDPLPDFSGPANVARSQGSGSIIKAVVIGLVVALIGFVVTGDG